MKKIGKLQINPEKLMKNEELMALRGGYSTWLKCIAPTYECMYEADNCQPSTITDTCNRMCSGWTSSICAGW